MAEKIRMCFVVLLTGAFLLAGCQSAPAKKAETPAKTGLSPAKIAILKQEGFTETEEGWTFSASEKLLFAKNESELTSNAQQSIARLTRILVEMEILDVRVDGHTDTTGSQAYNDQLSLRRAKAVAEVMSNAGMPSGGISVRGLGSRIPVASNQTPEGRAQNRRVVLVIAAN